MKNKPQPKKTAQTTHIDPTGSGITSASPPLYVIATILAAITFVIYLPALQHGFIVNWDDNIYVLDNKNIQSLSLDFLRWALIDYKTNLWHPLSWISHAIDYAIWELNPFGHHLTSIILHAVNTGVVVFLTSRLLTACTSEKASGAHHSHRTILLASAVTGLLFGIHPLHVESVAWVTERKDLLYSLFYMLSVMSYMRYAEEQKSEYALKYFFLSRHYQVSLLLCALSLSSKPMAVTLPVVLLLLDWYPLYRMEQRKDITVLILEKLPFFLLSAMVSVVTVMSQKVNAGLMPLNVTPLFSRLLLAMKSLMLYLFHTIAPSNLLPLYSYPKNISLLKPEYAFALALVAVLSILCIMFISRRYYLAVWLFFVISLLPVLGLIQAGYQSMADRFVYLPVLGPFLLIGSGIGYLWGNDDTARKHHVLQRAGIAVAVIACSASLLWLTCQQIGVWKNAIVMWSYLVEKDPGNMPKLLDYRASAFEKIGQPDKALEDYATALKIEPKNDKLYFNRATNYLHQGKYDQAILDYSTVISLVPREADAYINRGNTYLRKGDLENAIKDMNKAIELNPAFSASYVNRGNALSKKGESVNALADLNKALSLNPDLATVYIVRGKLNMQLGNFEQGLQDFKTACKKGLEEGCRKTIFPF